MKKITLALLFLLVFKTGFSQWEKSIFLNTQPGGSYFTNLGVRDVIFISESTGIYCHTVWVSPSGGFRGFLKVTPDSGHTWTTNPFRSFADAALHVVKKQNTVYFCVMDEGFITIAFSIDTGKTWTFSPIHSANGSYVDFSAVDTSHYFILKNKYGSTFGLVSKYVNGKLLHDIDTIRNSIAKSICFTTIDTGYVACRDSVKSSIYKSITGGTNWQEVFSDSSMKINKLYFTTSNTGYAIGEAGKLVKTIDGGKHWEHLASTSLVNLNSLYFINDSIGSIACDSGSIIHTTDGGRTWQHQTTGTTKNFVKIFFINDSIGFALAGEYLYKINRNHPVGIWELQNPPTSYDFSFYPNPSSGTIWIDTEMKISSVTIFNSLGEKVYTQKINSAKPEINAGNQPKGIYFIQVMYVNNSQFSKTMIFD